MKVLTTEAYRNALVALADEQIGYLLASREEIAKIVDNGSDTAMLEAAPKHLAITYTLGAYRTALNLLCEHSVDSAPSIVAIDALTSTIVAFDRWLQALPSDPHVDDWDEDTIWHIIRHFRHTFNLTPPIFRELETVQDVQAAPSE